MKRSFFLVMLLAFLCVALLIPAPVAHAEENTVHESDDNGYLDRADPLDIGTTIVGALTWEADVDCFMVETTIDGNMVVDFQHQSNNGYAYCWYMEVMDAEENVLKSGTLSGQENTNFSVPNVKPGIYYIRISKISGGNPFTNGYSDAEYMLNITSSCANHPSVSGWFATKAPTCSEEGEKTKFCHVCNAAVEVAPDEKLPHDYTDWVVIDEAKFLEKGKQQRTCQVCQDVATRSYHTTPTKLAFGGGALLVVVLIIAAIVHDLREPSSYSYSSSSSSSSSSYSGGYSGGSYSGYSGGSYGSSSYGNDDIYTRPADGSIYYGGTTHNVYTSDAEGYSTAPYIEDAEGYKTYVDPGSVEAPFNWCDL